MFGWNGNLRAFWRDPLVYMEQLHKAYGPVAAIAQGRQPIVCVFGSAATELLQADTSRFHSISMPIPPMTNVQLQHIEAYHRHTIRITQNVTQRWGAGQLVDVIYVMRRIALQSAFATFFGTELASDELRFIGTALQQWTHHHIEMPKVLFSLSVQSGLLKRTPLAQLRATFQASIDRVRAGASQYPGFLPTIFRDADALEGSIQLLAALHAMTALAFGWTMLLLSQHLGVLHDAIAEVKSLPNSALPTLEQLERLSLLDGVVRESMRVAPPLGIGAWITTTTYQLHEYQLPEGTVVLYSPVLLQRASEFFYAPDRFRPQRWNHIEAGSDAFLPFGAEPCADFAMQIALFQVKLVLVLILQHRQLVPAPGPNINRRRSLLLAPQDDIPMVIAPLDRQIVKRQLHGNIHDLIHFP
jgi:cytochrome P450